MATLAIPTPSLINPTNEVPFIHRSFLPAATISQGQICIWDANRRIVPTTTAPAAGTQVAGIALRSDRAGGQAISLLQCGFLFGYDLTGRALYDKLGAGASGLLDTAALNLIGMILPFNAEGVLAVYVDVRRSWV
jgi:hypothetical protein